MVSTNGLQVAQHERVRITEHERGLIIPFALSLSKGESQQTPFTLSLSKGEPQQTPFALSLSKGDSPLSLKGNTPKCHKMSHHATNLPPSDPHPHPLPTQGQALALSHGRERGYVGLPLPGGED